MTLASSHHEITLDTIRNLETMFALSWPAERLYQHHGWMFRSTLGITRRANSVLPLAEPGDTLDRAIEAARAFYDSLGRPTLFHLSPVAVPSYLDEALAELGYTISDPSEVLAASVQPHGPEPPAGPAKVTLLPSPSPKWLDIYTHDVRAQRHVRQGILNRISLQHAYAIAFIGDRPAGTGLVTLYEDWAGLSCMATAPDARRQGVATAVFRTLRGWARQRGAIGLAMQVDISNAAARNLSLELGFRPIYPYHYRSAPAPAVGG